MGLINHRLGRIAVVGDTVQLEGARLEVLEMDEYRVSRVLFQDQSLDQSGNGDDDGEKSELRGSFVQASAKQILKREPAAQSDSKGADQQEDAETSKEKSVADRED